MVEVFKTNIEEDHIAEQMVDRLHQQFPELEVNFDLQDCDHILRVEGSGNFFNQVAAAINAQGFLCEVLED